MSKNIKNINMIELSMESGNEDVRPELSMMQRAYARLHQTRTGFSTPTYASNYLQTDGQTNLAAVSRPSMKSGNESGFACELSMEYGNEDVRPELSMKSGNEGVKTELSMKSGNESGFACELSEDIPQEYRDLVSDILQNEDFLKLRLYRQHNWSNRLMHSINVSYMSWYLAKKWHCNEKVAARAGLLHDFCLFDFHEKPPTGEHQAFFHPKAAAENSIKYFHVSERERSAILTHMFPLGPIPKNKEAWIITLADKICATAELCSITIALARKGRVRIAIG